MPDAHDLCTIAQMVQLAPGYTVGDDAVIDATLAALITEQSIDFADYTGREFKAKTEQPETRLFEIDHYDCEERELYVGDVDEITAIEIVDAAGTVWQTLDPSVYVLEPRIRDEWEPVEFVRFPLIAFPSGVTAAQLVPGRLASITGTFGFPDVPPTVAGAVARMTVYGYLADVAGGETTKFAVAANQGQGIGVSLQRALTIRDRWRRKVVG